jgi:glycopeptide antibiotics resistance protein
MAAFPSTIIAQYFKNVLYFIPFALSFWFFWPQPKKLINHFSGELVFILTGGYSFVPKAQRAEILVA